MGWLVTLHSQRWLFWSDIVFTVIKIPFKDPVGRWTEYICKNESIELKGGMWTLMIIWKREKSAWAKQNQILHPNPRGVLSVLWWYIWLAVKLESLCSEPMRGRGNEKNVRIYSRMIWLLISGKECMYASSLWSSFMPRPEIFIQVEYIFLFCILFLTYALIFFS